MTASSSQQSLKRPRRKWLIGALIGLGALAAVAALRCRPPGSDSSSPAPVTTTPRAISCLGRIEPDFEVITLSAPSNQTGPSLIATLKIEEGDEIKEGQLIATLDNR